MYCTLDDLKQAIPEINLIQLTNDAPDATTVDQTKIDGFITDSVELIDSNIRGQYTLPINPVPGIVKQIAVDITLYKIYSRRYELEMPETMAERFKQAMKLLEQIRKGDLKLNVNSINNSNTQGIYRTNKTSGDRIFNAELLSKF